MKPQIPNRLSWVTILVLLLVPALLAGGFLWGTWKSDDRLSDVTAAVVNLDEMVTINGQTMPLGRQLAADIVDTEREQNITWVLANEEKAQEGLENGTYAAVVTIPEDFSKAATSFAKPVDEAEQATITVQTSKIIGISETALGQSITYAAVNSLNEFLAQEYLKNVYLAFNDQSTSMLELVDGTQQLADGATQLADGTAQSADGASQLADGLQQASDGGTQLRSGASTAATGASSLSTGAAALADGADSWVSGAKKYATGVHTFADGMDTYTDGVGTFADGAHTYADGVGTYASGINSTLTPVMHAIAVLPEWGDWASGIGDVIGDSPDIPALVAQADQAVEGMRTFIQTVQSLQAPAHTTANAVAAAAQTAGTYAAGGATCPAPYDASAELCEAYQAGAQDAGTAVASTLDTSVVTAAMTVDGTLTALDQGAPQLVGMLDTLDSNLDALATWAPQLQEAYEILDAEMPDGGMPASKAEVEAMLAQLVEGGNQLTTGGQKLAAGADQLAGGADKLNDGAGQLATGADKLASGSTKLSDGMSSLAAGTTKFASGLGDLSTGITKYTKGIDSAADGATQLADGLGQLSDGMNTFTEGTDTLASSVAEGQKQIPTYTDAEATTMATSVDQPVDAQGLSEIVRPALAWSSLLLVLALWVGALATFAAVRPVRSDALTARSGDLRLLGSTLLPGLGIVAAQAALLTVIGTMALGLTTTATFALGGVLLVAGLSFALMNHALAALMGNVGRVLSLGMILLTAITAATSAAPAPVQALSAVMPSTTALNAVRAVGLGTPVAALVLTLVGWGLLSLLGSLVAVHRARTVRPDALLTA